MTPLDRPPMVILFSLIHDILTICGQRQLTTCHGTVVLAFILILELTTKRRRGLFIGMVNAGFTTGISLGAVVFGALISSTGWVMLPPPHFFFS